MTPLVAIVGAGASLGSGRYSANDLAASGNRLLPPLTRDLFDEGQYGGILRQYDLAHQAGRFVKDQLAAATAIGLEAALHRLTASEHPHRKQMAIAVPPYLQHLLHAVSEARYTEAFYYDRLIDRLLCLPYVFFVSLNYDVLLDRRLHSHHPLSELASYINDPKWSLIKPHGSVNWYCNATSAYIPAMPPLDLQWGQLRCISPTASLSVMRNSVGSESQSETERYPALAMPEGPDDKLVMPRTHKEFFVEQVRLAQEIDILLIGYSGLDHEILTLIKSTGCKIRHMTVVSQDASSGTEVMDRFKAHGLHPVWNIVADVAFATWATDGLDLLVAEYDGPYPRSA